MCMPPRLGKQARSWALRNSPCCPVHLCGIRKNISRKWPTAAGSRFGLARNISYWSSRSFLIIGPSQFQCQFMAKNLHFITLPLNVSNHIAVQSCLLLFRSSWQSRAPLLLQSLCSLALCSLALCSLCSIVFAHCAWWHCHTSSNHAHCLLRRVLEPPSSFQDDGILRISSTTVTLRKMLSNLLAVCGCHSVAGDLDKSR